MIPIRNYKRERFRHKILSIILQLINRTSLIIWTGLQPGIILQKKDTAITDTAFTDTGKEQRLIKSIR